MAKNIFCIYISEPVFYNKDFSNYGFAMFCQMCGISFFCFWRYFSLSLFSSLIALYYFPPFLLPSGFKGSHRPGHHQEHLATKAFASRSSFLSPRFLFTLPMFFSAFQLSYDICV